MKDEVKILWPSWRYGPKGEAQIFEREEDVPQGWENHPNKFKEASSEMLATSESTPEEVDQADVLVGAPKSRNGKKNKKKQIPSESTPEGQIL